MDGTVIVLFLLAFILIVVEGVWIQIVADKYERLSNKLYYHEYQDLARANEYAKVFNAHTHKISRTPLFGWRKEKK